MLNLQPQMLHKGRAEAGWADAAEPAEHAADAPEAEPDLADEDLDFDAPQPPIGARSRRVAVGIAVDDEQLAIWLHGIARQDQSALEALYHATSARVMGLVVRITQRQALAEEVLEETFWQVWRQAPRYDAERGRAITWLLAMARSRAIDALRREQRFVHEELPDADALEGTELADAMAPPPPDLMEATRTHECIHAAVAQLEPRARQLVALAFFRGLTHEEIAEQQALPLGTVKSLIRRALQQLRRVMENDHE
jgi:RNA polymerase sigma-70 factor (ECF subfamily)